MEQIYEKMCEQDADVVKVAVTAQKTGDNLRVMKLLKDAPKDLPGGQFHGQQLVLLLGGHECHRIAAGRPRRRG